jgi:hypothetical protein
MEIKKFEAYTYNGKDFDTINRKEFIDEIIDVFADSEICGYDCVGTAFSPNDEILYLHMNKYHESKLPDFKVIKLDLSDMGIEFGTQDFDDEKEEMGEFVPEVNLDTDITKQVKNYKKSIGSYNL